MEKIQIITKLQEIIHDVICEGDIDMKKSIVDEYGVNSISLIRLIVAIEHKFDISFTDYELALSEYDTFGDLVATIEEKLA